MNKLNERGYWWPNFDGTEELLILIVFDESQNQ